MFSHVIAFIFYTLAMIGIMLIGFIVYKKTFFTTKAQSKNIIKIIDTISIGPRKVLMIIKIHNERFLIASSGDETTFISKLENETVETLAKEEKLAQQSVLNIADNNIIEKIISQKMQLKQQEILKQQEMLKHQEMLKQQEILKQQEMLKQQEHENQINKIKSLEEKFKNLYSKDIQQVHPFENKKEAVKQLIKELNETTNSRGNF